MQRARAGRARWSASPSSAPASRCPTETIGPVLPALARLGGAVEHAGAARRGSRTIEAILPAARAHDLRRQLPGLTGGEGVLESVFAGYEPVSGEPPTRRRTTPNPLNLSEYLMHLARRVQERS